MARFTFGSKDPALGAKSRAVVFFLVVIIFVAALIGYLIYRRHHEAAVGPTGLAGAPGIESIPAGGMATSEYVKLQQRQNILQAQQAERQGTSAVPTITRTSYFGPAEFQAVAGRTVCSPEELRKARAAGVTADELRCKGCTLAELKAAGYTAGELAAAGYSPTDLRNAGFTASQLREAGFNPAELKKAGFNAKDLVQAGFSPASLAQAGFSNNDLVNAGVSPAALASAGIGVRAPSNMPKDCSVEALRAARARGIPAAALRKMGCGATALRAAGYTAGDLRAAGFTPEELKAAGFSAADLRAAGFTAGELKRAGFNANDLKNAGFSAADLKNAGFSATDLKNAGFSPDDLLKAGYTGGDLLRAGFTPAEAMPQAQLANCSPEALRQARAQGISASEIYRRGCSAAALLAAGYTPAELKAAGYTDNDLRNAGLTPAQIAAASAQLANLCSPDALRLARAQGVPVADLRSRGCSAAALIAAGYTPAELKAAGFTDEDLRNAGLTPAQIASAQQANLCSPDALRLARAQGVSVADLRRRGCSAGAIAAAGYTPAELRAGGFTDADLRAAGIGVAPLAPGVTAAAVIPPVGSAEQQLAQLQASQEQQLNEQQKAQKMTQVQSSMVSQANSLFSTWTPPALQQFVEGEHPPNETPAVTGGVAKTTATAVGSPAVAAITKTGPDYSQCAYIKGGDIVMGVLTSSVNSDENSPVMATVVSGKLRGAKLIGQFTLLKNKVLISFTKMNMPGKPQSIGINAVAIDPQTAHTALADCVDNHYLLRYGTLFASSFLSGLADAISQQGSQTAITNGGILVTHTPLNAAQTFAVALGAVGSQYASVLGSNFTRPPTVHVYAGNSIGILFMQDLTDVPDMCCPDIDKSCNSLGGATCSCVNY
jgi:intracellular multiplication protein IcmE